PAAARGSNLKLFLSHRFAFHQQRVFSLVWLECRDRIVFLRVCECECEGEDKKGNRKSATRPAIASAKARYQFFHTSPNQNSQQKQATKPDCHDASARSRKRAAVLAVVQTVRSAALRPGDANRDRPSEICRA